MKTKHKLTEHHVIVLSDQEQKISQLQKSIGPSFLNLSESQQKELITCYPQIILSFPEPRSKELILTAVSIDYSLIGSLNIDEVDDEIMTIAIETCQSFESRIRYSIEKVLRKKKFSQKNENLILEYWLKDISAYALKEMNLSQQSLFSIIKKRPRLFEDLAPKCSFEVCRTAILKTYENVKHLSLCNSLTDLEILELSKLALSRNESAFQYITAVKAQTAKEALDLLDKKIKLYSLMDVGHE